MSPVHVRWWYGCLHFGEQESCLIHFVFFHSSEVLVTQSCQTLCDPMDCSLPGSSVCGDSPGMNTGMGCHFLLQGTLPDPVIEPGSPVLAGGFFTTSAKIIVKRFLWL